MRRYNLTISFVSAALLSGCVSPSRAPRELASNSTETFTAEQITRSGSTTAWDFLRARARRYDFYEDRYGRPRGIKTRRGRSTINMADSDTPMILVDGARVSDFGALRDLPPDAISSIELLGGISGTVS